MLLSSLSKIPSEKTSHEDVSKIQKKVFLQNGDIPHLTQFAQGYFQPGCLVPNHVHNDMSEIFFVEEGEIEATVDGKIIVLQKGDCLSIQQGENHSLQNTSPMPTTITYFSVI